ncbi:Chitin synthase regulatory factor 3 [Smittium culicis]|uniref:Chitin synthase regulatory factor 3 n=1 Tax=Smittium culicis TaxID=133412 RepID=A0A1R1YNC3_9FUNG|nr:Chitin synthase regulatory factor 3 [Smittium culicis]
MYQVDSESKNESINNIKSMKRLQAPRGPRPESRSKNQSPLNSSSPTSNHFNSSTDSGIQLQDSDSYQDKLDLGFDLHTQAFPTPATANQSNSPSYSLPPVPSNASPHILAIDTSDEHSISPNLLSNKNVKYNKNISPSRSLKDSAISDYEYISEQEFSETNGFASYKKNLDYSLNDPSTISASEFTKANNGHHKNSTPVNLSDNSFTFDSGKDSLNSDSISSSFEKSSLEYKSQNKLIHASSFSNTKTDINNSKDSNPMFIAGSNPSSISSIESEKESGSAPITSNNSDPSVDQNRGYDSDFASNSLNPVILRKHKNNSQNDINVHSMLFRKSMYNLSSTSLSRASMGNSLRPNRVSKTLLDTGSAMNMYREAALKTNDESIQLEYAKYLLSSIEVIKADLDPLYEPGSLSRPMTSFSVSPSVSNLSPSQSVSSLQIKSVEYESSDENKTKLVNEAVYWIKLLQKKGNPEASFILGTWLEEGKYGIIPDKSKAYRLYMHSAKCHHAKSAFKVAEYYEQKNSNSRAISYYKVSAALSNSSANYRMATCLLRGELGMRQNLKTALIYLRRAAELADESCPDGAYVLALIYLNEYPEKRIYESIFGDNEEAHKLLDKAAHLGMPEAQHKLGYLFEFGEHDFPANPYASVMYYRMAADSGFALSQMALSGWYLSGAPGVLEQSDNFAFDWCSRAAEQGLSRAQFGMGYYYDIGIGVERDSEKALQWYRQAANNGSVEAKERLEKADFNNSGNISAANLRKQLTVSRKKNGPKPKRAQSKTKEKSGDKEKEKEMCTIM